MTKKEKWGFKACKVLFMCFHGNMRVGVMDVCVYTCGVKESDDESTFIL